VPRDFWVLPEEKAAIIAFHDCGAPLSFVIPRLLSPALRARWDT